MFYKSIFLTLLISGLALALTDAEQKQKAAAKSLAFYKQKAAECAAKNTSALILDITKRAAIGAVLGAGAGAALVGIHMLDVYMHPAGSRYSPGGNILSRSMPHTWINAGGSSPGPLNFSEELVRTGYPSAIDFRATRHGYSYEVVRDVFGDFDFSTQILPVEKALEGLKKMRSIYIKQNLCILGLRGAAIGALLGTGYALYKQYYASTPAWLAQLDLLQENDFAPDPIMLGGKAYLVSQQFQDTAVTEPSYEFYFMPKTAELVTVYKHIIATLETLPADLKKLVACVSIRLVPNTSYSGMKILPRIVAQLHPHATQKDATTVLAALYAVTRSFEGDGKYPRYSQPATNAKNNLIYIAFGNSDMKDKNPGAFERKGSWLWRAKNDMAYQNSAAQGLSLR